MCFETEAGTGARPGSLFPADSDIQVLVPGVVLRERRQESWRGNRADLAAESRKRRPALMQQDHVVHNCVHVTLGGLSRRFAMLSGPSRTFIQATAVKRIQEESFFLLLQMKSGIPPLRGGKKRKKHW